MFWLTQDKDVSFDRAPNALFLEIMNSLQNNYLRLANTVVLVTDYYYESMEYLSFIFGTPYFTTAGKALFGSHGEGSEGDTHIVNETSSTMIGHSNLDWSDIISRNRAQNMQHMEGNTSRGYLFPIISIDFMNLFCAASAEDFKSLQRILELHHAIYQATLLAFFSQFKISGLLKSNKHTSIHSKIRSTQSTSTSLSNGVSMTQNASIADEEDSRAPFSEAVKNVAQMRRRKKVKAKLVQRVSGKSPAQSSK